MSAVERDWTSSTLAERIEHVRTLRGQGGKPSSYNALAKLAGIERGPLSRYVKPTDRKGGATPEVLARMADGWGVSFAWLALGRGQPEDVQAWERARSKNLEVAIAYHEGRFSPTVLQEVRSLSLKRDDDPSPEEWTHVLQATQQEHDFERVYPERARERAERRQRDTAALVAAIRPTVS